MRKLGIDKWKVVILYFSHKLYQFSICRNDENEFCLPSTNISIVVLSSCSDSGEIEKISPSSPCGLFVVFFLSIKRSAEDDSLIMRSQVSLYLTQSFLLTYYYEAFKGSSKMDLLRLSLSPAGTTNNHPASKSLLFPPKSPALLCIVKSPGLVKGTPPLFISSNC